jgi:multidrug efflux pump subunit AcrA (membrane-fusion protein)
VKKAIVAVVVLALAAVAAYVFWWRPQSDTAAAPPPVTAKVHRGTLRLTVPSTGRVVSNLDVDIKCKASGEIMRLPYDVSDTVKKDTLLVELDPIDEQRILKQAEVALEASQARLAAARQSLTVAERTLETDRLRANAALASAQACVRDAQAKAGRVKELLAGALSSQEEYDTAETLATQCAADLEGAKARIAELETQELALDLRRQDVKLAEAAVEGDQVGLAIAQDRLRDTKVVAPIDGVVAVRNVQIGQIISSGISNVGGGTTILTLSDLSRLFVLASVDESDIGSVRLDQEVAITADAFPGKTFPGRVVRIATRGVNLSNVVTFEVKIEVLGNEKSLLKPEMTANVEIVTAVKEGVLLAPAEAVVRQAGGRRVVTVLEADGTTRETAVEPGLSDGTVTEILVGLAEGQTVVERPWASESKWRSEEKGPQGLPPPPPAAKKGPAP